MILRLKDELCFVYDDCGIEFYYAAILLKKLVYLRLIKYLSLRIREDYEIMKKYLLNRLGENSFLFILIFLGGALKVGSAYCIGNAFTELIKYNIEEFNYYIKVSGLIFLFYLLSLYLKITYENYVTQKMITDIRLDISSSITKNNFNTFHNKKQVTIYLG
ncbi:MULTISPECIES: hypothetical protein [unclassified Gemella]|uniref:hypothetical protein n=1 Tax=unclassified Gemella TaxID=2624949 RepID=UPI001D16D80F|nr:MULTISPECIES: hypothetical protein [unclassified Gemella]